MLQLYITFNGKVQTLRHDIGTAFYLHFILAYIVQSSWPMANMYMYSEIHVHVHNIMKVSRCKFAN